MLGRDAVELDVRRDELFDQEMVVQRLVLKYYVQLTVVLDDAFNSRIVPEQLGGGHGVAGDLDADRGMYAGAGHQVVDRAGFMRPLTRLGFGHDTILHQLEWG